jgi:hypothetical protein
LGNPVIELLNSQPNETILDLVCGVGALTRRIGKFDRSGNISTLISAMREVVNRNLGMGVSSSLKTTAFNVKYIELIPKLTPLKTRAKPLRETPYSDEIVRIIFEPLDFMSHIPVHHSLGNPCCAYWFPCQFVIAKLVGLVACCLNQAGRLGRQWGWVDSVGNLESWVV